MTKKRAVIIDDERDSREIIAQYLAPYHEPISLVGEAHSVQSGVQAISEHKPDIVFLDIQLSDGSGFDLLKAVSHHNFDTIFISAHDHYAIDAIKHHAFDYILKPIDGDEFNTTLNTYLAKKKPIGTVQQALDSLLNKMQMPQVTLPTLTGFKIVNANDIVRLDADGSYTRVYLQGGNIIMTSRNLKEYEQILPQSTFCRIHNTHLINIQYVREYIKGRGGQVVLEDGTCLKVAQSRKSTLLQFWKVG